MQAKNLVKVLGTIKRDTDTWRYSDNFEDYLAKKKIVERTEEDEYGNVETKNVKVDKNLEDREKEITEIVEKWKRLYEEMKGANSKLDMLITLIEPIEEV